ncbi:MAG: hydantoinase/oxoprolinase family protein [Deltaproteobacteria bacterium]|nr:hydantoinase/oxoprolinase family protein [Deltaproteobacteria bacterium]
MVGVDIGGTFTDCVVVNDQGEMVVGKSLSTPPDYSAGAADAVRDAARNIGLGDEEELLRRTTLFFHACTIGENTLITRSGPRTGLVATRGFPDTLLMMRGKVTDGLTEAEAGRLAWLRKPEPFVPRSLVAEVNERMDYKGSVTVSLDEAQAAAALDELVARGAESVAVCLLWSVANDVHEKAVAEILRRRHPDVYVTLSSAAAPFVGEYERTATTVFNAYIGPRISAYLTNLHHVLQAKGLAKPPMIMQAYGGVLDIDATCRNAVGTVESGPASGVVGSRFLGEMIGENDILATDMGGTTFKVGVVREGRIERDYTPVVLRHRVLAPKIWVESVGAGGGSIAWIDSDTGLLKVGPEGAGASPGPVCYGLGGVEPTVSDADVILGYLNPDYFLGGRMRLDRGAALRAVEQRIAEPLGMNVTEAARGIYRIANAHMSDLIRRATVEKGHDPRSFVMFAFGGAGPMHASRYAADLGVRQVVIPLTASVHGATGLISSDVVHEYGKSDHLQVPADPSRVNENFAELIRRAEADLGEAGFGPSEMAVTRSIDMRYRYQVHELNVPLPTGTAPLADADLERLYIDFDDAYEKAYGKGSGYREAGKEILTFRATAVGLLSKPRIKEERPVRASADDAQKPERSVFFEELGDFAPTTIYDFQRMGPGMELSGPAVIETPVTTVVVNPRDRAEIDGFRNIRILVGDKADA